MKHSIYSILVFLTFLGCGTKHKPIDKFTYNFQFYNYENDQVDEKGVADYENIIGEFRKFPWKEQMDKLNLPDVKSNPTIGIKDHLNDYDFGITAYPKNNEIIYVIYYSYKTNGDWEESFREGYSADNIEKALKLFFDRQNEKLPKFLLENSTREFGTPLFE